MNIFRTWFFLQKKHDRIQSVVLFQFFFVFGGGGGFLVFFQTKLELEQRTCVCARKASFGQNRIYALSRIFDLNRNYALRRILFRTCFILQKTAWQNSERWFLFQFLFVLFLFVFSNKTCVWPEKHLLVSRIYALSRIFDLLWPKLLACPKDASLFKPCLKKKKKAPPPSPPQTKQNKNWNKTTLWILSCFFCKMKQVRNKFWSEHNSYSEFMLWVEFWSV